MSRVASDTIKGYLYQFLKSFNEVLLNPGGTVIVEGEIEDIDVEKSSGDTQAIQCKYFESQNYSISSLLPAILELFLNYKINKALNKNYKYKLFVYINENRVPSKEEITLAIANTKNEDNIIKYLSNLYVIKDEEICFVSL